MQFRNGWSPELPAWHMMVASAGIQSFERPAKHWRQPASATRTRVHQAAGCRGRWWAAGVCACVDSSPPPSFLLHAPQRPTTSYRHACQAYLNRVLAFHTRTHNGTSSVGHRSLAFLLHTDTTLRVHVNLVLSLTM